MSNQPLDKETMIKVYKFGSYYNPASNHYGSTANVVCDRCYKNNLDISIGWQTYDLCLVCTNEINNELKSKSHYQPITPAKPIYQPSVYTTNMMQNQFKVKSMMLQRQFKNQNNSSDNSDDSKYLTFMMQDQFY